ncbi:P450 family fatty acid hydroxylase [Trichophaea hybrida]|nr:P450 family fatty acid hydroxylase [Trichophaea hybrida]
MEELTRNLAALETSDTFPEDDSKPTLLPIPGPPGLPIIGNIRDFDPAFPLSTFLNFAEIYGPIFEMTLGTAGRRVFISSVELFEEVCDESRFHKVVTGALETLRNGVGSGLFTAHHGEKDWLIAHRILMPAFGPLKIRDMFDDMHDIASQLVLKWARYGPKHKILATDDFTRLTLDTLSLCAMGYRFNSFYTEEMHPFVDAMVGYLFESGKRAFRPSIANKLMRRTNARYDQDIKYMRDLARELVQGRRNNPTDKNDLLNAMINGRDPKTGEGLNDELICNNMITFLIAGHETTSGLLSFTFYNLIKNSAAYRAAQKEVDEVCGKGPITIDHIPKLKYINAVLRETLRLNPTATTFSLAPHSDLDEHPPTLGKGKYSLEGVPAVICVLQKIHRDPKVYGADANEFKPERMLDEAFEKLPKAAWKPFGNGMRACIGRPFAWQEAVLVTTMLLQHFNFQFDDPGYELHIKQTLTIKPKDFYMRATLREGMSAVAPSAAADVIHSDGGSQKHPAKETSGSDKKQQRKLMSIFYGSNTGTCEALAQSLATNAAGHGFDADVRTLDSATEKLPKDHPVVIITASYEGQPPDNATHFVEWLKSLSGNEASGTNYAVFGCGHRDWQTTFQRIPTLVNDTLHKLGGTRMVERGVADAAEGDMFTKFDTWEDELFWPAIDSKYGGTSVAAASTTLVSTLTAEISSNRSSKLRVDVSDARVIATKTLTAPDQPEKRHLEIQLPSNAAYSSGDYLAVLPINPKQAIHRAMKRFQLPWDARITLTSTAPTALPTNYSMSAHDIFAAYVELSQPATKKNVLSLAAAAVDPETKSQLEALAGDQFQAEITQKRISPLDLLERYPCLHIPLGSFLAMLPPMRVRQYSISSSPLHNADTCTVSYDRLEVAALSGSGGNHYGVASNFLSSLEPGDILRVAVRASAKPFHLPLNPAMPIVMIAIGTGIAPFRGFVQERAVQILAGRTLGNALLFVGCRYHDKDRLYAEEFDKWQEQGAVQLRYAFSREPELSEGCKYVQDRLGKEKAELFKAWEDGARVFVCGNARLGEEVAKVCKDGYRERRKNQGEETTEEAAEEWFGKLKEERFATDVFD